MFFVLLLHALAAAGKRQSRRRRINTHVNT
jgi:hypothetical protein